MYALRSPIRDLIGYLMTNQVKQHKLGADGAIGLRFVQHYMINILVIMSTP